MGRCSLMGLQKQQINETETTATSPYLNEEQTAGVIYKCLI